MANIIWAAEQLKQGNKIRISTWINSAYIYEEKGRIKTDEGNDITWFGHQELESNKWELFIKKKETLFDKTTLKYGCMSNKGYLILKKDDVRSALRNYISFLLLCNRSSKEIVNSAQIIFGEELIE